MTTLHIFLWTLLMSSVFYVVFLIGRMSGRLNIQKHAVVRHGLFFSEFPATSTFSAGNTSRDNEERSQEFNETQVLQYRAGKERLKQKESDKLMLNVSEASTTPNPRLLNAVAHAAVVASPRLAKNMEGKLSERLTVIMATSPRPAGHCILHIRSALRSLYQKLPELLVVTLRIAFDGCPQGKPQYWEASWCNDYAWQKEAVRRFVKTEFPNAAVNFDYMPENFRGGLGGNLRNTMQRVSTPFVYVIQDDFVHNAHFNVTEVLDTFVVNPAIEYIRLNVLKNGETGLWDYAADETVIGNGKHLVKKGLTRGCNWSDNNHFVPTLVYLRILESMKKQDAAPESSFSHSRDKCKTQMRWYLYGALGHPPMLCHVDGMYRKWNKGRNGPQKRECPSEHAYNQYLAQQCPISGLHTAMSE
jgi:hypothetical protein